METVSSDNRVDPHIFMAEIKRWPFRSYASCNEYSGTEVNRFVGYLLTLYQHQTLLITWTGTDIEGKLVPPA